MKCRDRAFVFFLALCCFAQLACAAVVDWSVAKVRAFEQTSDVVAPTVPFLFDVDGQFNGDGFDTVSLEGLSGGPAPLVNFNANDWEGRRQFIGEAAFLSEFPGDGILTIVATSSAGTVREDVLVGAEFPGAIPFFTGNAVSRLGGVAPGQDFMFTWEAPPATGGIQQQSLLIIDQTTDLEVWAVDATGLSSAVLPAGTLAAGGEYLAVLEFFDVVQGLREGFAEGEEFSGTANATGIFFSSQAVPEPTSLLLLGLGAFACAGLRRRA
ncbi:hypothetical protein Pla175_09830 [Pirellulimonas nuda]|uniref:Ice-binding protein C-terminal domain-containing protein n=1 Tax=Pirellulimonas nuda TaxID=2528009 RepID=A0A518D829_9BACT|nr:PEP-CTERM sorting domain-containing protein [Pirellulimonas nuda]QDU87618.1 hypothetical protein Pla175_09830 [Pirellulimonas nuda]